MLFLWDVVRGRREDGGWRTISNVEDLYGEEVNNSRMTVLGKD